MNADAVNEGKAETRTEQTRQSEHNPAVLYLDRLSEKSRRTMRWAMDRAADLLSGGHCDAMTFPWGSVKWQQVVEIRPKLVEQYRPATANRILSALRGVLRAAWESGQVRDGDYYKAMKVQASRVEAVRAGRIVTQPELMALMEVCADDPGPIGARDAAVIALLYSCGLGRAELVNLDIDDYDPNARTLAVAGNQERILPVVNGAAGALADWLAVRGDEPGALFLPVRKGGHVEQGRLGDQAVYDIPRARAAQAGTTGFSPRDFRRTFVRDLLSADADITTVQKMAGHASVVTTLKYDARPQETMRKVADLLHIPYPGRVPRVEE